MFRPPRVVGAPALLPVERAGHVTAVRGQLVHVVESGGRLHGHLLVLNENPVLELPRSGQARRIAVVAVEKEVRHQLLAEDRLNYIIYIMYVYDVFALCLPGKYM